MKRDLTDEQLRQEVTVALPLSVVLRINGEMPMQTIYPEAAKLGALPEIGAKFKDGRFAGVSIESGRPVALVLLDGQFSGGTHEAADAWAKGKDGVRGVLPSRFDNLVLWHNREQLGGFLEEYYWCEEQRAGDPVCAWCQGFGNGGQGWGDRSGRSRAVAVRRYPFQ